MLQLLQKRYEMFEKFTGSMDFGPDYYTVPIGAYTDVVASDFLKMPGSDLTMPNLVPKGTSIKFLR